MKLDGPDIVKRIDGLLDSRKEKRQALADALGFSVANIAKWKTHGSTPTAAAAVAIAGYLGVSIRWLLTGQDEQGLTLEERNLVNDWNRLTAENQRNLRALMASMLAVMDSQKDALARAE
jgi:transcriptional regulator with XRE-family HTH domain